MRSLVNRNVGQPVDGDGCSFRYTHENGHKSCAWDYQDWERKIYEHRVANRLPIPDNMMAQAEDQLCGLLPPERCIFEVGDARPVPTSLDTNDIVRGMKAYGKLMADGASYVDQAEADRRAAICVSCPFNINAAGCAACRKVAGLVFGVVAQRKTKHDSRLRSCAVCKCVLKAKIWFPKDILDSVTPPEIQAQYPDHCWLKT